MRLHKLAIIPALLMLGVFWPAAAEPFTFMPTAVGLNGGAFTADTLVLSDNAQITFGDGGTTFVDTGYLPVVGFRLDGQDVTAPGLLSPDGGGWGASGRSPGGLPDRCPPSTGQRRLGPAAEPDRPHA